MKTEEEKKAKRKEYGERPKVKERKKEYNKQYYQKNKNKMKEQGEKYRRENKDKMKEWEIEYYKKNKKRILKRKKEAYKKNKGKILKRNKKWRGKNKDKIKESKLKRVYGISLEEYNKLLKKQGGVCAICRNKETIKQNGKIIDLGVDHNHKTKKVRELLCSKCNPALGNLNEDISLFYKCIEYLKKHQTK